MRDGFGHSRWAIIVFVVLATNAISLNAREGVAHWEASAHSITELSKLCQSKGIDLGIVAFPIELQFREGYDPARAQPQGRLKQLSSELEILYIDLYDSFRGHIDQKIFSDGIHLTSYGHEITAREVVLHIVRWKGNGEEASL